MILRVRFVCGAMAVLLCTGMNGCGPSGPGQFEEEKESHYQAGNSAVKSMDYGGGIEQFEKAVEVNPHNASAHFQLGWLDEEKAHDPAAAIYHYEQFLKFRPGADNAEVVRQHINNCKQDLAKTVLPLPVAPGMQREFEQLAAENKKLREENERWKAYFASITVQTPTNPALGQATTPRTIPGQTSGSSSFSVARAPVGNTMPRTHVIQQGDTLMSIAKKYGVKLQDLLNANPGLDPRRMHVGKSVNIPHS